MKVIEVIVKKNATLSIEPKEGLTGPSCRAETRDLEKALGRVTSTEAKPEMYAPDIGDRTTVGSG